MVRRLPDYYGVLGLNPNATMREIRKNGRLLLSEVHPDKFDNEIARYKSDCRSKGITPDPNWIRNLELQKQNSFQTYNQRRAAYDVLSDVNKKAGYDAELAALVRTPPPPSIVVEPLEVNFGSITLTSLRSQSYAQQIKVDNLGGPLQSPNLSINLESPATWLKNLEVSPDLDVFPIMVLVAINRTWNSFGENNNAVIVNIGNHTYRVPVKAKFVRDFAEIRTPPKWLAKLSKILLFVLVIGIFVGLAYLLGKILFPSPVITVTQVATAQTVVQVVTATAGPSQTAGPTPAPVIITATSIKTKLPVISTNYKMLLIYTPRIIAKKGEVDTTSTYIEVTISYDTDSVVEIPVFYVYQANPRILITTYNPRDFEYLDPWTGRFGIKVIRIPIYVGTSTQSTMFQVTIDGNNKIPETDETDNTASTMLEVVYPTSTSTSFPTSGPTFTPSATNMYELANLVVKSSKLTVENSYISNSKGNEYYTNIEIEMYVQNIGIEKVLSYDIVVNWPDGYIENYNFISRNFTTFPYQPERLWFNRTIPRIEGHFQVVVILDKSGRIKESDEGDNVLILSHIPTTTPTIRPTITLEPVKPTFLVPSKTASKTVVPSVTPTEIAPTSTNTKAVTATPSVTMTKTITPTTYLPNLKIKEASISLMDKDTNLYLISYVVENNGGDCFGCIGWLIIEGDEELDFEQLGYMKPGEHKVYHRVVKVPTNVKSLRIWVDKTGLLNESNENDNYFDISVTSNSTLSPTYTKNGTLVPTKQPSVTNTPTKRASPTYTPTKKMGGFMQGLSPVWLPDKDTIVFISPDRNQIYRYTLSNKVLYSIAEGGSGTISDLWYDPVTNAVVFSYRNSGQWMIARTNWKLSEYSNPSLQIIRRIFRSENHLVGPLTYGKDTIKVLSPYILSPTRTHVAFVGDKGNGPILYVVTNGGKVVTFTTTEKEFNIHGFSPNGRNLLISESSPGVYNLKIVNTSKIEMSSTPLIRGFQKPFWSPDSKLLAYINTNMEVIGIFNTETGLWSTKGLPTGKYSSNSNITTERAASFSPDGTQIVYEHEGELYIVDYK